MMLDNAYSRSTLLFAAIVAFEFSPAFKRREEAQGASWVAEATAEFNRR
jgi:hypothetical protein